MGEKTTEQNGVILQAFHWYTKADGNLWNRVIEESKGWAEKGITALWLPPAYKGVAGGMDVGYGVYDLFDLGEFDQKGSVRTKYGTKDEYLAAVDAAHSAGIEVYADVVLNHRMGADKEEEFKATPMNPDNRLEPIGEMTKIKAWTHFTFPGRQGNYSKLQWHWWHFNGVDHNALKEEDAVYLIEGKTFAESVDQEKGNFDYLMGCNLDMHSEDVIKELHHWGRWYLDTTNVDGFRFDAAKHVSAGFFCPWLTEMEKYKGKDLFAVGEYWSSDPEALASFLDYTAGGIHLFDVNLHYHFAEASKQGGYYDLRRIFDDTLVKSHPHLAVTWVSNHDSQPLQSLEMVVEPWFIPLAYGFTLLRIGGYPCLFIADYDGAHYKDYGRDGNEYEVEMISHQWILDRLLEARKRFAWGEERDYFNDPNLIGWTRFGLEEYPGGMAVVVSNKSDGSIEMVTGNPETTYYDITEHVKEEVTTDNEGKGLFGAIGTNISVWVPKG